MIRATPFNLLVDLLRTFPRGIFRVIIGNRVNVMSHEATIEALINGKSLVRWADGETAIARGKSIGYQKSHPLLMSKLRELSEHNSDNLIFGLPWTIRVPIWSKKFDLRLIKIHLSSRIFFAQRVHSRRTSILYGDTLIWYTMFTKIPDFLSLIAKDKRVCLIASESRFLGACPPQTKLIKVSSRNAFDDFTCISRKLTAWIRRNQDMGVASLILLAAGPTSKAIALDFHSSTQCIDIGHGFNFHLHNKPKYAWEVD
jgi:hypothetical protein